MKHRSVPLVEDGRLVGLIADDEIYKGILRQTGAAAADADRSRGTAPAA